MYDSIFYLIFSYNSETYRSEESLIANIVLQRLPTPVTTPAPVSTPAPATILTPATTQPICVITKPIPYITPPTPHSVMSSTSSNLPMRKMTRSAARTNREHCCNVCSTTFNSLEELQFHLEVFHLCIKPTVVPPIDSQSCPHCGGNKFSNIVTHLSRFHTKK